MGNPLTWQRDLDQARAIPPGTVLSTEVTTPPTSEALSIEEAKQHLVLEGNTDDLLVQSYLEAARSRIEEAYGWAIGDQTITETFTGPASTCRLTRTPVRSVTSVTLERDGGDEETVTISDLSDGALRRHEVRLADGHALLTEWGVITVVYQAGYKLPGKSASGVPALPPRIIHAMRLLLSDQYDHRGTQVVGTVSSQLPQNVRALLGAPTGGR